MVLVTTFTSLYMSEYACLSPLVLRLRACSAHCSAPCCIVVQFVERPTGYPLAGCSSAEPTSVSPVVMSILHRPVPRNSEIAPMPSGKPRGLGQSPRATFVHAHWRGAPTIFDSLWCSCEEEATAAAPISREGSCELSGPCTLQLCAGLAAAVAILDTIESNKLDRSAWVRPARCSGSSCRSGVWSSLL